MRVEPLAHDHGLAGALPVTHRIVAAHREAGDDLEGTLGRDMAPPLADDHHQFAFIVELL